MATTLYSTKSETLECIDETALGTGAWPGDKTPVCIRPDGDVTFPYLTRQLADNPNRGHAIAMNLDDKPVSYEMYQENALKFPYRVRNYCSTGTTVSRLVRFFQTAGCSKATTTNDTIDTGGTVSQITLATGLGAQAWYCRWFLFELAAGYYWPCFVRHTDATGKICTPWMQLPSIPKQGGAGVSETAHTLYPVVGEVGAGTGSTVQFRQRTRANHTTTRDWCYTALGCALGKVDPFVIKPGSPLEFSLNFHVAQSSLSAVTQTIATGIETFCDTEKFAPPWAGLGTTRPRFGYAAYDENGDIANTNVAELIQAEVDLGINTIPVVQSGDAVSLNGVRAYFSAMNTPTIKVTWAQRLEHWTELETGITEHFMEIIQPTAAATTPSWGLAMPRCYLTGFTKDSGKEFYTVEATYRMISSSDTSWDTSNAFGAPWYLGLFGTHA